MMAPLESIEADPPNVWLKYFDGFDPGVWGHVGFTYEPHRARLLNASEPGVLIVIAATSRAAPDERRRILGILQCPHETGSAETYSEPRAFAAEAAVQSTSRWSHAIRAVRAWRVLRHHRMLIEDFAPTTYTPDRAQIIGSAGMCVTSLEARRILDLDLEEVDVFGQPPVGRTTPGPASKVLTPSRPGPVSQTPFMVTEAEGPKHLYVLTLSGKAGVFLNDPSARGRIVKVGFSGAPEDRLDAHNRHIPMGQFRWGLHRSTEAEGRVPFPTSAHGLTGEAVMIRTLHADGRSLGGEFFLAEDAVIDAAWQAGLDAGATA